MIDNDIYIGATCQTLSRRMASHRFYMTSPNTMSYPLYKKMREVGIHHFYIELIATTQCENAEQLRAIEGDYIRQLGTLNGKIEGRTRSMYSKEHKKQCCESSKRYYEKTKHIKYTCDVCHAELSIKHKARHERTNKHQQALNNITNNEDNISDNI